MAPGDDKSADFYAVLGLKKECSPAELRNAYKKLALRWHPDRCTASGNSKYVEESKKRFQAIQEAYSVLSDADKRFLYDVGVYNSDDDDENGMGDFFGEMAAMMNQNNSSENGGESFEELQELFEEMFQRDNHGTTFSSFSSSDSNNSKNKRDCSDMSSGKFKAVDFSGFDSSRSFCLGAEEAEDSRGRNGRRSGRKQKVSSRHDVSSRNAKISA